MKKKIILLLAIMTFIPLTVKADSTWELAKSSITVGVGCKVDIPLKMANATGSIKYVIGDSSILSITGIDNEEGLIEFFDAAGEDQSASSRGKINTLKEGTTTITINAADIGTCNGKGAACAEKENVVNSSLNGQSMTLTVNVTNNATCTGEINQNQETENTETNTENKSNPETGSFIGIGVLFIGVLGIGVLRYSKKQKRF